MENENVQQPSYEQLMQAYNAIFVENQKLKMELDSVKIDKLLEKLKVLNDITMNDSNSDKVKKLAEWHMEQILAKPKIEKK